MKNLKVFGLALLALVAMAALFGVGSASATVLCKAKETPCSTENRFSVGTVFDITLKAGTSTPFQNTEGTSILTCKESTTRAQMVASGSSTTTVKLQSGKEEIKWGGCTSPWASLTAGEFEIHYITGTSNGTVTAKGFETTVSYPSINLSCVYVYGSGLDLGVITGGSPAALHLNVVLPRSATSSIACPLTARFLAEETFTEPNTPIYVAAE